MGNCVWGGRCWREVIVVTWQWLSLGASLLLWLFTWVLGLPSYTRVYELTLSLLTWEANFCQRSSREWLERIRCAEFRGGGQLKAVQGSRRVSDTDRGIGEAEGHNPTHRRSRSPIHC